MQRILASTLQAMGTGKPAPAAPAAPSTGPELPTAKHRRKERLLAAMGRLQDRDTHKAALDELEEAIAVSSPAVAVRCKPASACR